MSWKDISRIEQIFRKERGEKAIIIRLVKENDELISIILGLEDKNTEVTLELTVEEWNNLLLFFDSIESKFERPQASNIEKINEIPALEAENPIMSDITIEEFPSIASEPVIEPTTLEESPVVTILHKTIPSVPKTEMKPITTEVHKTPSPPNMMLEPVEIDKEVILEIAEPEVTEAPEAVVIETIKPPETKPKAEPELVATPEAVVIETIKPPEAETETKVPTQIEMEEYEAKPLNLEETGPSSRGEELYPPMPPEVKEIFEELDIQSIELEKTLLESGIEIPGDEITKEAKITGAMQEVAELMPPGPAKDFVEQMIIKRKETQSGAEKTEEHSDKKETKEKTEKKEDANSFELKYW